MHTTVKKIMTESEKRRFIAAVESNNLKTVKDFIDELIILQNQSGFIHSLFVLFDALNIAFSKDYDSITTMILESKLLDIQTVEVQTYIIDTLVVSNRWLEIEILIRQLPNGVSNGAWVQKIFELLYEENHFRLAFLLFEKLEYGNWLDFIEKNLGSLVSLCMSDPAYYDTGLRILDVPEFKTFQSTFTKDGFSALIWSLKGDLNKALGILDKYKNVSDASYFQETTYLLYWEGICYYNHKDYFNAVSKFKELEKIRPDFKRTRSYIEELHMYINKEESVSFNNDAASNESSQEFTMKTDLSQISEEVMSENSTHLTNQLTNEARSRLQKVFTYIRELSKLRTPPRGDLKLHEWSLRFSSLPSHPTIRPGNINASNENDFDGVILRIKRASETTCPPPPSILTDWLNKGWEQASEIATYLLARNLEARPGDTITESVENSPERVKAFSEWSAKRDAWQKAELPARAAANVFSEFFKLQAKLQRESEKFQLYLGDGHLLWNSANGYIDHPILLKRVELEFDSSIPEFIVRELDDDSELYASLLRHHELSGSLILECRNRLERDNSHPFSSGKTVDFLKFFIHSLFDNGRYCESRGEIDSAVPSIYREPVIFLGKRGQGFPEALDKLIESLPATAEFSEALLRVVGIDKSSNLTTGLPIANSEEKSVSVEKKEIDFLLTKPANKEQERVIKRLEENGSVLVQGPPGTGKSHTIANIIGHLLASGKSVLVSSHTSKALKVVREKVAEPLQPLCVSVLDNDLESKSQLADSINGIVSYLSRIDSESLTREINQIAHRRREIKSQLQKFEEKALAIRKDEYTDIIIAGEGTPPSEAARRVVEFEGQHGWIPDPLESGAPLPLNESELEVLYATNNTLSAEDELCFIEELPDSNKIPLPTDMAEICSEMRAIDLLRAKGYSEYWQHENQQISALENISNKFLKVLDIFATNQWIKRVVEDCRLATERGELWIKLITQIESKNLEIAKRTELIIKHGPKTNLTVTHEVVEICREIVVHLESGGSIGFFTTAFKSSWRTFIAASQVDDGKPTSLEHFKAILAWLETTQMRREMTKRWKRQVITIGGPELDENEPEITAKLLLNTLTMATKWLAESWSPIERELEEQGFNLNRAKETLTIDAQSNSFVAEVRTLIESTLRPSIEARINLVRFNILLSRREKTLQTLQMSMEKHANMTAYLGSMIKAVENLDPSSYEAGFNRYIELKRRLPLFHRRVQLLTTMKGTAPKWAKAIEDRSGLHGGSVVPGSPTIAWRVCHWRQELAKRNSENYSEVQREIHRLKKELRELNAQYVEKLAWRYQRTRTGLQELQALVGWQQLQNRLTRTGNGRRDTIIKKEAAKTLKEAKNAVPVWIMPLSRVFESFDLVGKKFDVIILDEASQSDITALVAFAIAEQVIVVGDNEQVTPYAVGQELSSVQSLIDEHLNGIPNRMLYEGRTSVYDLAAQAFGESIRLVEHFRCVPDIIGFSNHLCYSGEIRPLRESSSSPYLKQLIAHRIDGATSENKTNGKEALEIASIIAAMVEIPEYLDASIGVISMVGQEQAIEIDGILQRKLEPNKYSRHKILCGNASQFQGDERDVMIISMIDTCDTPPLAMREAANYKKIFNVASSRARNQLWVVHSLNPSTDLQPGDLRLRLIQHAENPRALSQSIEAAQSAADPKSVVFEPGVIKFLMQNGFRVHPQFKVGAYTIDMVVQGATKRIAIECDGDKYHPIEKLADDIQRQMVLERLGWTFIRIRGSEYFRNTEATIKRVIAELEAMGIERLGPVAQEIGIEQADELQRKVLQRATELRREWENEVGTEKEIKRKSNRRAA